MSADHDYREGGWKDKYHIEKNEVIARIDGKVVDGELRLVRMDSIGTVAVDEVKGMPVYKPCDPNAVYFVLRLDEDPHAVIAALVYAATIAETNNAFCLDILRKVKGSLEDNGKLLMDVLQIASSAGMGPLLELLKLIPAEE
jgi:hypothetical protein